MSVKHERDKDHLASDPPGRKKEEGEKRTAPTPSKWTQGSI